MAGWLALILIVCALAVIAAMGLRSLEHSIRHSRPIPMATEIRHKGPIVGQTVKYYAGSTSLAAIIAAVNADGTVNLMVVNADGTTTTAASVRYDDRGILNPSWHWSVDL